MPFTKEEIYIALMDMNGDKALGPDGFTVAFWQSSWELVKEEIMDLLENSMTSVLLLKASIPLS